MLRLSELRDGVISGPGSSIGILNIFCTPLPLGLAGMFFEQFITSFILFSLRNLISCEAASFPSHKPGTISVQDVIRLLMSMQTRLLENMENVKIEMLFYQYIPGWKKHVNGYIY
jgi:hypothetical protein